jgi:hypothetical protein
MTPQSTRRTAGERAHATITHELIPLTCNEMRHLFINLPSPPEMASITCCTGHDGDDDTKARARISHYRRREATP